MRLFDWSLYATYAEVQRLKKNTVLFRQGSYSNGFYYLSKGKVVISVLREDGYERIIDFVSPGSLIGEQAIHNTTSFTTATLQTDSVLYYFSKDQFKVLSEDYPDTSHQFGLSLISKIRLLADINTILNASVEVQLAHFLLNLYEKEGNEIIELSQISLAKYIGKSRVSIWKVLKEWKKEGIIETNNRNLLLKDISKLVKKISERAVPNLNVKKGAK